VLFDQAEITAILDLDFMSERERIDDLALILYYARSGSTLPPDLTVEQRRHQLRDLLDAYDATAAPPLSSLEREALPLVLARIMLKYTRYLNQLESIVDQRAVLAAEWHELDWSSAILSELPDWQEAFA
jgi:Ser/Thr protein kinase RdoA (MazF antagonist)